MPPALSSSTSEPMMSEGIRSGVNWMRLASRPSTLPSVSTSSVLARPGTPISSAWPPDRMRDERALDHLLLAEDDGGGGLLDALDALAGRFDAADDGVVGLCECAHDLELYAPGGWNAKLCWQRWSQYEQLSANWLGNRCNGPKYRLAFERKLPSQQDKGQCA